MFSGTPLAALSAPPQQQSPLQVHMVPLRGSTSSCFPRTGPGSVAKKKRNPTGLYKSFRARRGKDTGGVNKEGGGWLGCTPDRRGATKQRGREQQRDVGALKQLGRAD